MLSIERLPSGATVGLISSPQGWKDAFTAVGQKVDLVVTGL